MTAFILNRTVRFGECDPAGVLYYPVYFNWTHESMESWFEEALGFPYANILEAYGFPSKSATFQYISPCRVGEAIRIEFSLKTLRTRSFEIDIRLFGEDNALRAHGHVVCVCIAVDQGAFEFKPSAIPAHLHDLMAQYRIDEGG